MPARTSMELLRNAETGPPLKYSPRKREMEIEKGIDMKRAINEVRRVPARKGRAPNFCDAVSQVLPMKNPAPKVFIDGIEARRRVRKMAINNTTTVRADK